jgi:hypothetical protein
MAMKWLEERWAVLLPALEPLGVEQEEQIRALCEAEIESWRQRPGLSVRSLRMPMTLTRNRIREVLLVGEENSWRNPKSGQREHLALKYLNFAREEWISMTLPGEEELSRRLKSPLALADPEAIVACGETLLKSETWPEMVLGIGLNTGRTLAEILKTGVFRAKTTYSLLFASPITVEEKMSEWFEIPTFARAELVLEALSRVRQMFGMQFAFVTRRDVGRQCGPMIEPAVIWHFGHLVPLRPSKKPEGYKSLIRGVASRLFVHYYCPEHVDELLYLATVQQNRRMLEASSEKERLTFAITAGFLDYVLLDGSGGYDERKGIRLGEPGVEVPSVFRETVPGRQVQ